MISVDERGTQTANGAAAQATLEYGLQALLYGRGRRD